MYIGLLKFGFFFCNYIFLDLLINLYNVVYGGDIVEMGGFFILK